MSNDSEIGLEAHLRQFFLDMALVKTEEDRNEGDVGEFIFHVTECVGDFKRFCAMSDEPANFNEQEAKRAMQSVIYHALPHLIAAARLYDYVPDIL